MAVDNIDIHIRGTCFRIEKSNLRRHPFSRLGKLVTSEKTSPSDLTFSRNAFIFNFILDCYTNEHMHLPPNTCTDIIREEMEYWEIDDTVLAPCCWNTMKLASDITEAEEEITRQIEIRTTAEKKFSRKERLYRFFEYPQSSKKAMGWFVFILILTITAILCLILESEPQFRTFYNMTDWNRQQQSYEEYMTTQSSNITGWDPSQQSLIEYMRTHSTINGYIAILDTLCITIFLVEYILRFYAHKNHRIFCCSVVNVLELLALVPHLFGIIFYIIADFVLRLDHIHPIWTATDILLVMRLFRVFRVFRIMGNFQALNIISSAIKDSYLELLLLSVLMATASCIYAILLYYIEMNINNIFTIPDAIWWAFISMTTVGYGDFYPKTGGGYVVAVLCVLTGIILIAMPIPIVVSNFGKYFNAASKVNRIRRRKIITSEQKRKSLIKHNSNVSRISPNDLILEDIYEK